MNKPTLNDLFCGCGGMGKGFQDAGFDILGAWDWDSNAIKSYIENVGDHANVLDIKEMTYDDLPPADVWTFGFPCQDLSIALADKRKGLFEGERSSMFFHVMRLLDETKELEPENMPKVIMAENVKGLRPYLDTLREEYAKRGYIMHYTMYNSKWWGLAQNRDRYFVVGIRKDLPQTFEFPIEQHETMPKLKEFLDTEVDEKYFVKYGFKPVEQNNTVGIDVIGHMDVSWGYRSTKEVYGVDGISPTLTTSDGGYRKPKIMIDGRIRELTPNEYAKLQGFKNYKIVVSNRQAYRQFGNAVSVNVSRVIATKINDYLDSIK